MKKLSLWKPVDILTLGFLALLAALVILFRRQIPGAPAILLRYAALAGGLTGLIRVRARYDAPLLRVAHAFYAGLVIPLVFDTLDLVHQVHPRDFDPELLALDRLLFGGEPAAWLAPLATPWLTDLMMVAYTSYYPSPYLLAAMVYRRQPPRAFDETVLGLTLVHYLSWVGYSLVPALGPRFAAGRPGAFPPLPGWLIGDAIIAGLNSLERIKRDAFPSGHTAAMVLVVLLAARYAPRWRVPFLAATGGMILATFYGRYHYGVDILAGILLAVATFWLAPRLVGLWNRPRTDPGAG